MPLDSAPKPPAPPAAYEFVYELTLDDGSIVRRRADDLEALELLEQISAAAAAGLPAPPVNQ